MKRFSNTNFFETPGMVRSGILMGLLGLILTFNSNPLHADGLAFYRSDKSVPANIELNDYFIVHGLQVYIIRPLELDLSPVEAASLIHFVRTNMSTEAANQIRIEDYRDKPGQTLFINFKLVKIKGDTRLLVVTNFDPKSDSLTEKMRETSFGTAYLIKGDRFIYYRNEYDAQREKELKENNDLLSLADDYLLDEKTSNDGEVPGLLDRVDQEDFPAIDKTFSTLTRAQIAMIDGRLQEARKHCDKARTQLNFIKDDEQRAIAREVLTISLRELQIMQILRDRVEDSQPAEKPTSGKVGS